MAVFIVGRVFRNGISHLSRRRCVSVAWDSKKKPLKIEKIGGKYQMSLISGEGSGSGQALDALVSLLICSGAPLNWELLQGDHTQEPDFSNILLSIKRNGIAIKGNLSPYNPHDSLLKNKYMNKNMLLRRSLDLHAFIIEIKSFTGLKHLMKHHKNIDIVIVRQNTEGDYTLLEHSPTNLSVIELLRVITRNNSMRLAETAFLYALRKKRSRVLCLHRADAMPLSESTFVDGFLEVAKRYGAIEYDVVSFGSAYERFVKDPQYLDVVVIGGLEGLILTNFLLGMIGGAHLAAGMNIGDSAVVVEPAARIRDEELNPNPTAYFLCAVCLLDLLGHTLLADSIRMAIEEVFLSKVYPHDLGGQASMVEFTAAVSRQVRKRRPTVHCSYDPPPTPATRYINPFTPNTGNRGGGHGWGL